jgi:hypothetical protein
METTFVVGDREVWGAWKVARKRGPCDWKGCDREILPYERFFGCAGRSQYVNGWARYRYCRDHRGDILWPQGVPVPPAGWVVRGESKRVRKEIMLPSRPRDNDKSFRFRFVLKDR